MNGTSGPGGRMTRKSEFPSMEMRMTERSRFGRECKKVCAGPVKLEIPI